MPRAVIGACGFTRRAFGVFAVAVIAVVSARVASADPLRGVAGEYIITRATQPGALQAQASPSLFSYSGGALEVRETLGHATHVVKREATGDSVGTLSGQESQLVDLDPKDDTCARLVAEGVASACSPNYEVRVAGVPNDPSFGSLWGLSAATGVDAPRAWDLSIGSPNVVVAVIDTGIDFNHPDLVNNIWTNPQEIAANGIDDDGNGYVDDVHGANTITGAANPGSPLDDHGHGTHVAGTIGAEGNNGVGVVGVMHQVKLIGLKFLAANGSGNTADAIKAIDYLVALKERGDVPVRVVNNSWGGGGYSAPLKAAIERAHAAGIIFVAAAGNNNSDNDAYPSYPASYEVPNVISVAAISSSQQRASFSNFGATSVHIAAPGVGILSTTPNGNYQSLSGTSMATPHVSGALGLLFSYAPSLTNAQAISRLYESGREIPGLIDPWTGSPYVSSRRTLDVGSLLHNQTSPLPVGETCAYSVEASNLLSGGEVDTAADGESLVSTADEGGYYALDLPFEFQFFSGVLTRVYLSPNGVIYKNAPLGYDYSPLDRAPLNSIAALHVDLTPRAAPQGVRVFRSKDKVVIAWSSEVYSYPGYGVVTTRATLRPSGEISVSAQFSETGAVGSLRTLILGDPTSSPVLSPQSVMGVTGPGATNAFTLNLASTMTDLGIGSSSPLHLGVRYTPLCSLKSPAQDPAPPEAAPGGGGGGATPSVTSVHLRRASSSRQGRRFTRFTGSVRGEGSGDYPVTVYLDRRQCKGTSTVRMSEGSGGFSLRIPSGVSRLGAAAGGRRASVYLPGALSAGSRLSPREHAQACESVHRSFR